MVATPAERYDLPSFQIFRTFETKGDYVAFYGDDVTFAYACMKDTNPEKPDYDVVNTSTGPKKLYHFSKDGVEFDILADEVPNEVKGARSKTRLFIKQEDAPKFMAVGAITKAPIGDVNF